LIAAELARRLAAGLAMPWAFKDADASDYPLEGNLLLGADQVVIEHPLDTPFGSRFRLDIAVLGPRSRPSPWCSVALKSNWDTPSTGEKP
jgi:hypothetical protein